MSSSKKPQLHEDWIDPYALRIVKNLQDSGFETYLVGGCVRDLMVGIHPKDFDIATSAHPNQVRKKVPNAYVIGRRFKLVLVKRGDLQFEVATFRRNVSAEEIAATPEEDTIEGDNYFGTVEEDAKRRDFTANAVFYDPANNKLIDFCGGIQDIENRVLRMIGDPKDRFIEDPIRILRAIRLSHKLHFSIESSMRHAIVETSAELKKSVLPRRREEWLKFLRLDEPHLAFMELFDLHILEQILPGLHSVFMDPAKMELFEMHLARITQVGINKQDPLELFAGVMFAFMKAQYGEGQWNHDEILNDPKLAYFMREEMGIFKQEAAVFFKALHLMSGLKKIDNYSRKGERRQMAFVLNEAFGLAMKLSMMDFSLSASETHYWMQQLEKFTGGKVTPTH
ncbi:poly(A) polymerase [Bdellovibrio sp. ZAP7]|uniref:CCA tRNA nucleotidyltransferase n=1 Tax=Bdellovibrio sp. ZAP7 TaxID=2231053 RepID=UPI00115751A0|nr:poly(A) polymerase [Bdellovibrio sp. ZAP7]QDK46892.1 poly(A) polymerase [Bdellovibrio sp. ZAP7]